ncbi:mucin-5AC isoform X2 [Ceratitis capitata]|nr:mucin-5AC isoform X2 [Ceratitis capitata]
MTSLTTTTAVETSFVATTKDAGGGVDEMKQTETSANALAEVKQEKTIEMISNNNPITDIVKETNAMTAATTITSTAAATTTSMAAPTTAVAESVVAEATTATTAPKQISAVATTTTPPHTSAASKIPHLQQQHSPPFTLNRRSNQLLHSPDALRRSASLRMRGSKSNLFNNYDEHYMEMERSTRHLSYAKPPNTTTNTRYSQPLGGVLGEQQQQQQQGQSQKESDTNEQHTHIHAAGSFGGVVTPTTTTAAAAAATATATRRKATHLFGSTLSTQTPAMTVGNLTRSQSLRRSYLNYSYNSQQKSVKTDALKEQSADGASRAAGTTAATGTDVAIQETTATDNLSPLKINSSQSNGSVPNGCGKQENDIMYKSGGVGEQRRIDRDMQRMSLNLNGSGGERTTTTKLPTAAAPAAAAASPVTPTGSGNTGTRITPANSISPKTPHNTAIPGQRYVKSSPNANPQETKLTPKTPPVTPDSPCTYLDDDLDSMYSFATTTSGRSTMSCEHPYVARNGTTFSGRKMKYVVHCSNYAGQVGPDYLTPTQRAARQVRRLKELLCLARQDLEQKDSEILRLTREVVELRLFKASLSSPEERSASSDAVTVREAELKTSQDVSPIVDMVDDATKSSPRHISNQHQLHHPHSQHLHHTQQLASEMQSSFADSGHFEDLSVHSKDSYAAHTQDIACGSDEVIGTNETVCHEACVSAGAQEEDYATTIKNYELQRQELIRIYEQKIEELIRTQDGASSELKRSHNDKVEALLQKLAECNTRYADIVPDYEHAKERIRELEKQLEDLQRKLAEHEDKQNKMYLHMYQKGQEAERIARADQALELVHRAPDNKVSINELLHQLQSTQDELENIRAAGCRKESGSNHALLTAKEAISLWVLGARKTIYRRLLEAQKNRTHVDPEVTLQFLKSAIYYFLTDKENSQGHLQAIESILEFTEAEKLNISKARTAK